MTTVALFGNFAGAYTPRRNVTYTGDVTVKGHALFDAVIGYRFPKGGPLAGLGLQVNAVNLFDRRCIKASGSGRFLDMAASLSDTLRAGSPRQVFGTIRKRP